MHRRTLLALAAIYAVLLGFVCWGLIETRAWVLQTYGTAEATENWNDFRQALTQGEDPIPSPVNRPNQRSDEPPIKILFSENFLAIVIWSAVILSILYWSVGIMIAGAMRTPSHPPASLDDDAP